MVDFDEFKSQYPLDIDRAVIVESLQNLTKLGFFDFLQRNKMSPLLTQIYDAPEPALVKQIQDVRTHGRFLEELKDVGNYLTQQMENENEAES